MVGSQAHVFVHDVHVPVGEEDFPGFFLRVRFERQFALLRQQVRDRLILLRRPRTGRQGHCPHQRQQSQRLGPF